MEYKDYTKQRDRVRQFEVLEEKLKEVNAALDTLNAVSGNASKLRPVHSISILATPAAGETAESNESILDLSKLAQGPSAYWVVDFGIARAVIKELMITKEKIAKDLKEL